jgi:hypothetical protein
MTTENDRGICPVCGDRVSLTDRGMVRVHLEPLNGIARWGREVCKGAGRTPGRRDR